MSHGTLQFIGSGDAFGTGGRLNTCFHVTHDHGSFLIDCGASSLIGLHQQGVDPNSIDTVFLSHLHGDHFAGLVFVIMEARFVSGRTNPLTIVGPKDTEARIQQATEALYPNCWSGCGALNFDLIFQEWTPETPLLINHITATPFEANHLQDGNDYSLRFEVNGKVLIYSGDTGWTDRLIPATQGGDLFICECFFETATCDFHMALDTFVENRPRLEVKDIIFTHLGPDLIDKRDQLPFPVAYDGLKIPL